MRVVSGLCHHVRSVQEQEYEAMKVDELNFKRLKEGSMR